MKSYIANITWKKYDWLLEEMITDKDCAIFDRKEEAQKFLADCHTDRMTKPGWTIDETWISVEED